MKYFKLQSVVFIRRDGNEKFVISKNLFFNYCTRRNTLYRSIYLVIFFTINKILEFNKQHTQKFFEPLQNWYSQCYCTTCYWYWYFFVVVFIKYRFYLTPHSVQSLLLLLLSYNNFIAYVLQLQYSFGQIIFRHNPRFCYCYTLLKWMLQYYIGSAVYWIGVCS